MAETAIALASSSRPRALVARRLAAHLFTLLFLAAWQAASLVAPSYLLPGPIQVAQRLWTFVTSARDLGHLGSSLFHVAAAIAISFIIGSLLALLPYYVPVLRLAIERRIGPFLNSFSAIGWTLLSIMWFGVSPLTVVFAIVLCWFRSRWSTWLPASPTSIPKSWRWPGASRAGGGGCSCW